MHFNRKRLSSVYILSKGFPQCNKHWTRVSLVVGRQKPGKFPRSEEEKLPSFV